MYQGDHWTFWQEHSDMSTPKFRIVATSTLQYHSTIQSAVHRLFSSIHCIRSSRISTAGVMRSLTTAILILLSGIPSSLGQLDYVFPRQLPGCQYPSISDGAFLNFLSPNETDFMFSITTPWSYYYPDAIRAALTLSGFSLARNPSPNNKIDRCGWHKVDTVRNGFWIRGDVSFKDLAMHDAQVHQVQAPLRTNHSSLFLHRAVDINVSLHRTPHNKTISQIHNILVHNSPEADIIRFIMEIFTPVICTLIVVTWMILLAKWIGKRLHSKPSAEEETQDIELSTLRGRSVSDIDKVTLVEPKLLDRAQPTNDERFFTGKSRVDMLRSSSVYSRSVDGVTLYETERR